MKRLQFIFPVLSLILGLTIINLPLTSKAQDICGGDTIPPEPGFYPSPFEGLDCAERGQPYNEYIGFRVIDTATVDGIFINIDSVKIDSVKNLPCGLDYSDDRNGGYYGAFEAGCIHIFGNTNDNPGKYDITVYVTAKVRVFGFPLVTQRTLRELIGENYHITVINVGDTCISPNPSTDSLIASEVCPPFITCFPPASLWTTRVTPLSARLNWLPEANADAYLIRGRAIASPAWKYITVPATFTFKDVSGLTNNTTFVWQVSSLCNQGMDTSAWSVPDTFTTGCYPPDSIWVYPITSTAVTFNWKRVPGAVGYEIRGKKIGGPWINLPVGGGTTTSKNIFGLSPNTTYVWKIRTWCHLSGSVKSVYTRNDTFTTASGSRLSSLHDPFDENPKPRISTVYEGNTILIFITGLDEEPLQYRIYDMTGKLISQNVTSNNILSLSIDQFTPGIYLLELKNSQRNYPFKLVIH